MSVSTLLRLALAVEVLGTALLASWLLPDRWLSGPPRWALALLMGALFPVLATALMLAFELTVDALADPRQPPGNWRNAQRVWAEETLISLRAFCWRMPFCADFADPPIVRDPGRRALLLVHGYACNRAVWLPLLRAGVLDVCNIATINLEPVFGSIDDYVAPLQRAIARLRTASGAARVVLVCHSMGGIAARAYLNACDADDTVERVITIGTPHGGTIFGRFAHSASARQMIRGSAWLARLDAATTAQIRSRFVCLASRDDNLIHPRASAALTGAAAVYRFEGVGHLAMLSDRRVWNTLADVVSRSPLPRAVGGQGEGDAEADVERKQAQQLRS
jgi:pimeloyl-ACP methyl ester carboxylesterase